MTDPLKSPLHERHEALGAKFSEFGGWLMPLQYSGVVAEHRAVRNAVGVFDVSHLGKVRVLGTGAAEFVNSCLTNDLGRIQPGQAQYTLACNDAGGAIDDIFTYLISPDEVFLVPNAANNATVYGLLSAAAPAGIEVRNEHRDHAVIAVQGTNSDETLAALGLPVGHDYLTFLMGSYGCVDLIVCRTGYTGERGYELVPTWADAGELWDALVAAMTAYDGMPCGLGARDTLRTEMGYPLHGQDLSLDISPVQARSGWAVGWKKDEFWGREALLAERAAGPTRVSRGLSVSGRGIPRAHCAVTREGEVVGEVTSGTFSPTLKHGVAMALLDPSMAEGDEVAIDVRGRAIPATVVKPPFVQVQVRQD